MDRTSDLVAPADYEAGRLCPLWVGIFLAVATLVMFVLTLVALLSGATIIVALELPAAGLSGWGAVRFAQRRESLAHLPV